MESVRISAAPASAVNTPEAANRPTHGREAVAIMVSQPSDTEKTPAKPTHGCNRCEARWYGFNMAHCSVCHRTFGGVGGFDKHRAGNKGGTQVQGECADPADIGLALNDRGTWVTPSNGLDFKAVFGGADE
jgi:hypothetical protein